MALIRFAILTVLGLWCRPTARPPEVLVGGPCDGCELVFVDRPATLSAAARIAPVGEPGEPLVIEGRVRDQRGRAAGGVIVYAYQTDAQGRYPPGATRHGALRGFVVTGPDGRYRFDTIRPGPYPDSALPQHVHVHVIEPGRCHYYLDDLVFTDDPRLTAAQRRAHERGRGGSGVATPRRVGGTWWVRRDLDLGAGIADYARCR